MVVIVVVELVVLLLVVVGWLGYVTQLGANTKVDIFFPSYKNMVLERAHLLISISFIMQCN